MRAVGWHDKLDVRVENVPDPAILNPRDANASRALFDRLDKNRDGYLTGSELTSQDALATNWISVDRDNDGRISRSEFTSIGNGDVATSATQRP